MTHEEKRAFLEEHIGGKELFQYLSAEWGERLGIYPDGKCYVGQSIGMEIAPGERPLAWVKCPGIGNIDMSYWREGWDCDELDDAEVLRQCYEDGNISEGVEELQERLLENWEEKEV